MKFIFKIIWGLVFVIFFIFFFRNMQEVPLRFFLDYEMHSPLALLLFEFFVVGAVCGVLGMASIVFRHRRDLSRHKKTISEMQKQNEAQHMARTQAPSPDVAVHK